MRLRGHPKRPAWCVPHNLTTVWKHTPPIGAIFCTIGAIFCTSLAAPLPRSVPSETNTVGWNVKVDRRAHPRQISLGFGFISATKGSAHSLSLTEPDILAHSARRGSRVCVYEGPHLIRGWKGYIIKCPKHFHRRADCAYRVQIPSHTWCKLFINNFIFVGNYISLLLAR
jgi:hypothetical protein